MALTEVKKSSDIEFVLPRLIEWRRFLGDLTPTLLVSPTGLEIIDTIIKLSLNELRNVIAAKLCKDFDLSRPKLSNT